MTSLKKFNGLSKKKAKAELYKVCGATDWVNKMLESFPFKSERAAFDTARSAWYEECQIEDYLEAFEHHPKIGDLKSLEEKFASTQKMASKEQAGVAKATKSTLKKLAKCNDKYEKKFGYIFIVCATGKSAKEMLRLIQNRLEYSKEEDLIVAMGEQFKITLLRLQQLINGKEAFWNANSQVTSHVLDTALGKPGEGILIKLRTKLADEWLTLALGVTNKDGRVTNLLAPGVALDPGQYEIVFDTGAYHKNTKQENFYPEVSIQFRTFDRTHYHIPLLLNPYGYSTYRGS